MPSSVEAQIDLGMVWSGNVASGTNQLSGGLAANGKTIVMPQSYARWPDGTVYIADGINAVKKWSGYDDTLVDVGLETPSGTPAIAGSGSGSFSGDYRCFVQYEDEAGTRSPISAISAEATLASDGSFDYSSLPIPSNQRVVKRLIWRNTAGQYSVFYLDIETEDLWSTSLSSTNSDATISANEIVVYYNDQGANLATQFNPPYQDKPIIVGNKGRLFLMGELDYQVGHVEVTNGSTTVQGRGTGWSSYLRFRNFYIQGSGVRGVIESIDVASQTLTLLKPWAGPTSKFRKYTIRSPLAQLGLVQYSEPGNPDHYLSTNVFQIQDARGKVKAGITSDSYLMIAFEDSLHLFSYNFDPSLDGSVDWFAGRGAINHRCWANLDGTTYVLDRLGIYAITRDGVASVSGPIMDLFNSEISSKNKIDWTRSTWFSCSKDQASGVIRWYVSIAGPIMPRHALCFSPQLNQWWIEKYPWPITCSASRTTKTSKPIVGSSGYRLLEHGGGSLDSINPIGYQTSGNVARGGVTWIENLSLDLPSSGVVGSTLAITKGRGKGQIRVITQVASGKIHVDRPWKVRPDSTSQYQVGAIKFEWRSGWYEERAVDSGIEILWAPTTSGVFYVSLYKHNVEEPIELKIDYEYNTNAGSWEDGDEFITVDASFGTGFYRFNVRQDTDNYSGQADYTSVKLSGFSSSERLAISSIYIGGTG